MFIPKVKCDFFGFFLLANMMTPSFWDITAPHPTDQGINGESGLAEYKRNGQGKTQSLWQSKQDLTRAFIREIRRLEEQFISPELYMSAFPTSLQTAGFTFLLRIGLLALSGAATHRQEYLIKSGPWHLFCHLFVPRYLHNTKILTQEKYNLHSSWRDICLLPPLDYTTQRRKGQGGKRDIFPLSSTNLETEIICTTLQRQELFFLCLVTAVFPSQHMVLFRFSFSEQWTNKQEVSLCLATEGKRGTHI